MPTSRVRLQLDADLWAAVIATAKARRIDPADLVSEALALYFNPRETIETAAAMIRELGANHQETSDQIRVVFNYIIDAMPHDIDDNTDANAGANHV